MRGVGRFVVLVVLAFAIVGVVPAEELRVNAALTWDLGLRVGVDYRSLEQLGYIVDVGSTLFGLEGDAVLTGNAFMVVHGPPVARGFQFGACVGIPDWRMVFSDPPAVEVALGGSARLAYEFGGAWGIFLRAGVGYPYFFEGDESNHGQTRFPFGLWPDLALGATYRL